MKITFRRGISERNTKIGFNETSADAYRGDNDEAMWESKPSVIAGASSTILLH